MYVVAILVISLAIIIFTSYKLNIRKLAFWPNYFVRLFYWRKTSKILSKTSKFVVHESGTHDKLFQLPFGATILTGFLIFGINKQIIRSASSPSPQTKNPV